MIVTPSRARFAVIRLRPKTVDRFATVIAVSARRGRALEGVLQSDKSRTDASIGGTEPPGSIAGLADRLRWIADGLEERAQAAAGATGVEGASKIATLAATFEALQLELNDINARLDRGDGRAGEESRADELEESLSTLAEAVAVESARSMLDLRAKGRFLSAFAEDDPTDLVSTLTHGLCRDIEELTSDAA